MCSSSVMDFLLYGCSTMMQCGSTRKHGPCSSDFFFTECGVTSAAKVVIVKKRGRLSCAFLTETSHPTSDC